MGHGSRCQAHWFECVKNGNAAGFFRLNCFPCVSRMVHHPKAIQPRHWSQHGPASLWNAFDTVELRLLKGMQLNIRNMFLMFCRLSVCLLRICKTYISFNLNQTSVAVLFHLQVNFVWIDCKSYQAFCTLQFHESYSWRIEPLGTFLSNSSIPIQRVERYMSPSSVISDWPAEMRDTK
jgi:hypothetical protein